MPAKIISITSHLGDLVGVDETGALWKWNIYKGWEPWPPAKAQP